MHDLAKMFLHCVNHWKLETPTVKKQHSQGEDLAVYKMNYTRSELSLLSKSPGKRLHQFLQHPFDFVE